MAHRRSIRTEREAPMLFPTTIAGSLPKPEWLAQPNTLWAPWKSKGDELARAKRDATMLAIKLQEDAGVDILTEDEQSRQHFVHGFLENIEGIDFAHKVEMGIRKDRYKVFFFKQKTAYEIGLGIPAEPLFRSGCGRPGRAPERFLPLDITSLLLHVIFDARFLLRQ